ncbi:MAG TPA: PspC domain-containing protein [Thermodesulfobacteriota bacterium]|nr:PspC domain-containing protein [Thermodesulfobacteriota bacterium]HNU73027.1 PspC domain-containing protein [Thermodesulfobacteriota bacterium]HOC38954.1 PspC domain-containing protein [Thermodesulfobacteriota bacterium]HQO77057.1 PspC domain-containing protein [Thermodesulfobacteriota bacterium]
MSFWDRLKNVRRSSTDKMIAGVCGGLADATGIPSWIWRAVFLTCVLIFGFGILPYLILWIAVPKETQQPKTGTSTEQRI